MEQMITGKDLENRDGGAPADGRRRRELPASDATAVERLAALEQRISAARNLKPRGGDLHCEDCFQRGRDAVLALLTGGA